MHPRLIRVPIAASIAVLDFPFAMRVPFRSLCAVAALLLAGCAGTLEGTRLAHQTQASPNFGARRVNLVVIHHTGSDTAASALRTLTDPASEVSAHYLVTREGRIVQLVGEDQRAWHAGAARWAGADDVNSLSIGIELDNSGSEPFAEPQIASLVALLADLTERHHLPARAFVGHADVAPRRKQDPSVLFPWRYLAQQGFGLWCDPPYPAAPEGFDILLALQALGFDTRNPAAAGEAFARHYGGSGQSGLAAVDSARLACIVEKSRSAN